MSQVNELMKTIVSQKVICFQKFLPGLKHDFIEPTEVKLEWKPLHPKAVYNKGIRQPIIVYYLPYNCRGGGEGISYGIIFANFMTFGQMAIFKI